MIRIISFTLFLVCSFAAKGNSNTSNELLSRIAIAKNKLEASQLKIDKEHKALANKLHAQLQRVKALRSQAKNIRRLEDEQLINIDNLKTRNQQWQAQQNYQLQLITSFEQQTNSKISNETGRLNTMHFIAQFDSKLTPRFRSTQLIGSDNKLANFESIKIGPIEYAINNEEAGIVSRIGSSDKAQVHPFTSEGNIYTHISALKEHGVSRITFDPTLGNAAKLNQTQFSFLEYIERGGTWAVPIICFALAALIIGIVKSVQLTRLPNLKKLETQMSVFNDKPLAVDEFAVLIEDLEPIQKSLMGIIDKNPVSQKRDDLLIAQLSKYKASNEKYIGVVTTCAAVAPLLGLLGTVSGMIHTFMMMNVFGSGDASVVSGGISQALITTELGLIVAIPSLIISALLTRKVKSYQSALETLALLLSKVEITGKGPQHG
ncbi:hypothetical protein N474_02605 [Pseudoalteromonas luteoviolacea CPMOR-2]|uniref:MotA/TolQ/ExbB proton channel domain-containing protein n=1 Tax=Pseudoalteromonas luteoviolacea DSM 6061 TaxID=1365250 RepID=A0A166V6P0_9GAMM|nr:MotA/TolQ/ExbB proton channel family protein [Pseudoalteromonas luteoviolacea]KZN31778.1 hypothetical protein N475_04785 [Pseudoalteromonas luteoviolacea DSM 6061]KZN54638.1 hypothetical protein N474_02605 [Pseudoalteromonas luteoviolacea CPMOR-2]MBE0389115.1 biopolymer transport protein ExbB [Pseudoalteromonas luteoviolacea DSM 6061]